MRAKNKRKFPKVKKAAVKVKLAKHTKTIDHLAKSKAMVVEADANLLREVLISVADHEARLMAIESRVSERGEKGAKGEAGERGQEGQRGAKGSGFWG